MNFMTKSEEE